MLSSRCIGTCSCARAMGVWLQAEGQETRLEQQLAEAREAVLQAQSDGQAAVQALQQQLEASQQQLAALPGPARPSEAGSVADDASSMPAGDGQVRRQLCMCPPAQDVLHGACIL